MSGRGEAGGAGSRLEEERGERRSSRSVRLALIQPAAERASNRRLSGRGESEAGPAPGTLAAGKRKRRVCLAAAATTQWSADDSCQNKLPGQMQTCRLG